MIGTTAPAWAPASLVGQVQALLMNHILCLPCPVCPPTHHHCIKVNHSDPATWTHTLLVFCPLQCLTWQYYYLTHKRSWVVWETPRHTSIQATLETWSAILLLHLLAKDVNDLAKKWRKKTWMKDNFACISYYYMNIDEAHPSKGSHMTLVTFMG
jgi:hypothetical protein